MIVHKASKLYALVYPGAAYDGWVCSAWDATALSTAVLTSRAARSFPVTESGIPNSDFNSWRVALSVSLSSFLQFHGVFYLASNALIPSKVFYVFNTSMLILSGWE